MHRSQGSSCVFSGVARPGLAVMLAAMALAVASGRVDVEGAPPQEEWPTVNVTFRDLPDDRLRSDGTGVYQHGVDGTFRVLDGQLHMYFNAGRRFHAWLPPQFYDISDPGAPPDFSSDGGLIYIEDVGGMAVNTTKQARAVFNVDGGGDKRTSGSRRSFKRYRWCEDCVGYSADRVSVTRTVYAGKPRWTVVPLEDGGAFRDDADESYAPAQPDAFLQEVIKGKYVYKGHHPLPFGLTIDCVDRCGLLPQ